MAFDAPQKKKKTPPFGGVVDPNSKCVGCTPTSDLEAEVNGPEGASAATGPALMTEAEKEMLKRLGNTIEMRLQRHKTKERKKEAGRKRKAEVERLSDKQLREVIDGVLRTMAESKSPTMAKLLEGCKSEKK